MLRSAYGERSDTPQALGQIGATTSGPNGRRQRQGSGSPRWTTRSLRSRTRPGCSRSATGSGPIRSRRCWTSGWRFCPTRSPTPTGPPVPLRSLHPAGRVLPDPDARSAGVGTDLLRAGDPGQPGHRPPRPSHPGLRTPPVAQRPEPDPETIPHPGPSPMGSPPACTSTTSTPPSSSTSRKDERYGPRPPSTTPATSRSGNVL